MSTPRVKLESYETVPKVIYSEGTDFGAVGRVILRKGEARIVWRSGSTGWSGIGMRMYYKALLQAENVEESGWKTTKILSEGGRLTNAVWQSSREKMAGILKVPVKKIPAELPDCTVRL